MDLSFLKHKDFAILTQDNSQKDLGEMQCSKIKNP